MRGCPLAVELADHHGAVAAVVDDAGLEIVGAEIDEAADRTRLSPTIGGDDELVEPVLRRHDIAIGGKMRRSALLAASV